MSDNTTPNPLWGPHFVKAANEYFHEVGSEAAGMIRAGLTPAEALASAEKRVKARRLAYSKTKFDTDENVVPLR